MGEGVLVGVSVLVGVGEGPGVAVLVGVGVEPGVGVFVDGASVGKLISYNLPSFSLGS